MTIDEAIKRLEIYPELCKECYNIHFDRAVRLGIEALRAVKQLREWNVIFDTHKLPSETED